MNLMSDGAGSPSRPDSRPDSRQDFLDVARALAAGMVFFEHIRHEFLPAAVDWPLSHFNLGFSGIILFFIISGYIIPASLERGKPLGSFWLRRAFRLIPAFYFSIALAAACALVLPPNPFLPSLGDARIWLGNLILAPDLFHRPYLCGVYWSLRLELIVYVAAALLAWAGWLRRAGTAALVLPAGILTMGLIRAFIGDSPYDPNSPRMACFMAIFGLWAYRRNQDTSAPVWAGWNSPAGLAGGLLAAGTLVYLLNAWAFPSFDWQRGLCCFLTTWGLGLFSFAILFAMRGRRMPAWACYLGRISYSTYLLHAFAWLLLYSWKGSAVFVPFVILLTLALSSASYFWIELPGIRVGRAVERWLWPESKSTPKPESKPLAARQPAAGAVAAKDAA